MKRINRRQLRGIIREAMGSDDFSYTRIQSALSEIRSHLDAAERLCDDIIDEGLSHE